MSRKFGMQLLYETLRFRDFCNRQKRLVVVKAYDLIEVV